jgi:hypothetical protein
MIESRAEKRVKEVLEHVRQLFKKGQHGSNPLVGNLFPFKAFHYCFFLLGTMQFDPEGEVKPKNSQGQREQREQEFLTDCWHMINPSGMTEIRVDSMKMLLETFYFPKYKQKVLTRLLEIVPKARTLNSLDGATAISIDPPKMFNFIKTVFKNFKNLNDG